jgi:hypothetical protein
MKGRLFFACERRLMAPTRKRCATAAVPAILAKTGRRAHCVIAGITNEKGGYRE